MGQFFSSLVLVFAIGMLIRWVITKRKKRNETGTVVAPPSSPAQPLSASSGKSPAFCPQCGQPENSDSQFCGGCGTKII